MACRPVGILDLTTARPRGDIACIVTVEHEVVCRGPNTEHAISDVADETAVLDWTRVDLPDATAVRAWQRERPDGRSVLSICAIAIDGQVVCRGDNGTGLLGYGDTMPRTGNHVIALSGAAGGLSIWGGDGYALLTTATRSFDLVRWTADATPALWQSDIEALMIADMPFTRRVSRGSRRATTLGARTLGLPRASLQGRSLGPHRHSSSKATPCCSTPKVIGAGRGPRTSWHARSGTPCGGTSSVDVHSPQSSPDASATRT